jgi:hypothetical protein
MGRSPHEAKSTPVLGPTQPAIQYEIIAIFQEVKRPEREGDNPPAANAEVKRSD